MKVAELITALQKFSPLAQVRIDVDDGYEAYEVYNERNIVMIGVTEIEEEGED